MKVVYNGICGRSGGREESEVTLYCRWVAISFKVHRLSMYTLGKPALLSIEQLFVYLQAAPGRGS